MYINFVGFEKALHSVHRDTLWIIMRSTVYQINWSKWLKHYTKISNALNHWKQWEHRSFPCYDRRKARLLHVRVLDPSNDRLDDAADSEKKRTGIRWDLSTLKTSSLRTTALCFHLLFPVKVAKLEDNSAQVGLKLNAKKWKVLNGTCTYIHRHVLRVQPSLLLRMRI